MAACQLLKKLQREQNHLCYCCRYESLSSSSWIHLPGRTEPGSLETAKGTSWEFPSAGIDFPLDPKAGRAFESRAYSFQTVFRGTQGFLQVPRASLGGVGQEMLSGWGWGGEGPPLPPSSSAFCTEGPCKISLERSVAHTFKKLKGGEFGNHSFSPPLK